MATHTSVYVDVAQKILRVAEKTMLRQQKKIHIEVTSHQNYTSHKKICCGNKKKKNM